MRNFNWISKAFFAISVVLCRMYLFSFPKTLIKYFLDRNNRAFFTSDLNLFTYIYANRNIFFTYLVYAPFFYFRCFIRINKFLRKEVYSISLRFLGIVIVTHFFIIICNHYDFSNRPIDQIVAFLNSNVKLIDLNYVLMQYYGVYIDFSIISICFIAMICFFTEKGNLSAYVNYAVSTETKKVFHLQSRNKFWSTFKLIWLLRIIIHRFFSYFFCGDGIMSDFIVIGVIIFGTEFICFSIRFCFILKRYNCTLIKEVTYLLLRCVFHICLKLLWNIIFSLKTDIRFLMFKFLLDNIAKYVNTYVRSLGFICWSGFDPGSVWTLVTCLTHASWTPMRILVIIFL